MLFALRHIVHRHCRVGVPGVALQHVHRQAEFGEPSKASVPESVRVAELDRASFGVPDINKFAESLQRSSVYAFVDGLSPCGLPRRRGNK